MKLRNKKTGEIGWLETYYGETDEKMIAVLDKKSKYHPYASLAELNEEWEDYKEPKEYWRITDLGELKSIRLDQHHQNIEKCKEIGNYFETKEEAEKAVEKLKAFKRLKDLGFRFDGIRFRGEHNYIEWKIKAKNELTDDEIKEFRDALQKVFGGKE